MMIQELKEIMIVSQIMVAHICHLASWEAEIGRIEA
jgi:hypothetical protein